MRNVFDQYDQPENKLTHALMLTLGNDRKLVRPFLKLVGAKKVPALKDIELGLQCVPGEEEVDSKDGKDGLPDGCFFDQDGWAVVIEAKVQAGISINQLKRHRKTSARYGYEQPHVVLLSIDKPKSLPDWATHLEWKKLYNWFSKRAAESSWAKHFVGYMQVFEAKMIAKDYSIRGTLTMFSGFKFDKENPYTYREGKRLIKILGQEFRKNKGLIKKLGIDPKGDGRGAITRGEAGSVWDLIPLKGSKGVAFTHSPHATIVIRPNEASVAVTIPNSIKGGIKKRLKEINFDDFYDLLVSIERNSRKVIKKVAGAKPFVYMVQRHYKSQRSHPETDGRIDVDLRTLVETEGAGLRHQPMWAEAIYDILVNKRTNIQFGVQVKFPYSAKCMQSAKAVDVMADAWVAMQPLLDFVE